MVWCWVQSDFKTTLISRMVTDLCVWWKMIGQIIFRHVELATKHIDSITYGLFQLFVSVKLARFHPTGFIQWDESEPYDKENSHTNQFSKQHGRHDSRPKAKTLGVYLSRIFPRLCHIRHAERHFHTVFFQKFFDYLTIWDMLCLTFFPAHIFDVIERRVF